MTRYLLRIDYDEVIEADSEEEAKEILLKILDEGIKITSDCIEVEEE